MPSDVDLSAALRGAEMLRLPLFEQGLNVARVLSAADEDGLPMYPTTAILMPRRSTKTTSIWAVLLGRCDLIPGYRVVTTAQDGTRARRRFREVARSLEAAGFESNGTGNIRWANGDEALEFANGSLLWVVPPRAGAFRSEAADCMLFDEAGELDLAKSDDLLEGALPLLDTRPMGQAIVAGTPAKVRAGLLWDTLGEGRRGEPGTGIADYSIRDDELAVTVDEDGVLHLDEAVLRRVHPGIGTLTTMAKMRARFAKMTLPSFEREYLCRFPFDSTVTALDFERWSGLGTSFGKRPARVALGFDVAPDGSSAAVVAAWRDEAGNAHGAVVDYRAGWGWVAGVAVRESRKHGRAPIAHDVIGANQPVAEEIARTRPRPPLRPRSMREMMSAAATVAQDLRDGRMVHYDQPALNDAVQGATWRNVTGSSGRLFGRQGTVDVAPLVAFTAALHAYDNMPAAASSTMVFATS